MQLVPLLEFSFVQLRYKRHTRLTALHISAGLDFVHYPLGVENSLFLQNVLFNFIIRFLHLQLLAVPGTSVRRHVSVNFFIAVDSSRLDYCRRRRYR